MVRAERRRSSLALWSDRGDTGAKSGQALGVSAAVITASASVFVAMVVFVLNQRAQIRLERRQARLVLINSQLRDLYGPLHALVDVNERLWEALRESSLPARAERRPEGGTDDWHRWRDNVLMPTNREMRDLIVRRADLLIEDHVPQPLLDFCAHVAARDVSVSGRAEGFPERALIPHPGADYVNYVRAAFSCLKTEQRRLLQTRRLIRVVAPGSAS